MNDYFVYILANKQNGTLYVGVTNNLERRMIEHKQKLVTGFTERHDITLLVYFEQTPNIDDALRREKRLKHWDRKWKLDLIEQTNPEWCDLSEDWN